jgi:hypothetical protein
MAQSPLDQLPRAHIVPDEDVLALDVRQGVLAHLVGLM